MKRFHNAPDKRALSVTVLRAVCSADVRAEAPKELREKTDRRRPGFVQEPPSRSSLWADHKRRCNSHSVRRLNCSLGRLGVLATAGHQPGSAEVLLCQRMNWRRSRGETQARKRVDQAATKHAGNYYNGPPATDIGNADLYYRLVFDLLSELFTVIAERIDGSSSGYHS